MFFVFTGDCTSSTLVSSSALDNCAVKPYFPQKTYLRFDQANLSIILGEKETDVLLGLGVYWVNLCSSQFCKCCML